MNKFLKASVSVILSLGIVACSAKQASSVTTVEVVTPVAESTASSTENAAPAEEPNKVASILDSLVIDGCKAFFGRVINNIEYNGDYIYYTTSQSQQNGTVLCVVNAKTSEEVQVSSGEDNANNFCIFDNHLFYGKDNSVYKADLDGRNSQLFLTIDKLSEIHVFAAGSTLQIFALESDLGWGRISRCAVDANGNQLSQPTLSNVPAYADTYSSTGVSAVTINGEGYSIGYHSLSANAQIQICKLGETEAEDQALVTFDDKKYAEFSAVDGKYIYCTTPTPMQGDGFMGIPDVCRFNTVDNSIETINLPYEYNGKYLVAVPAANGDTVYAVYISDVEKSSDTWFTGINPSYTAYRYSIESGELIEYAGVGSSSLSTVSGSTQNGSNNTQSTTNNTQSNGTSALSSDMIEMWKTLGGRWTKDNTIIEFTEYSKTSKTDVTFAYSNSDWAYSGPVRKAEKLSNTEYCFYVDIPAVAGGGTLEASDAKTGYFLVDPGAPHDGKAHMALYIGNYAYTDSCSFYDSEYQLLDDFYGTYTYG